MRSHGSWILALDTAPSHGYNGYRKGAAGRRLAPYEVIEVIADLWKGHGGYFFFMFQAATNRPARPINTNVY